MKKGWMVISIIVLVAVLLGTVSVGVGIITGADMARIFSVLDSRYHLDLYMQYFQELSELISLAFSI